jgi:Fe-S oxidoreductase/FAD/FMN-containing dehydrogenase
MISSNSSGARVPVYGTTADHVLSLEIILADGRIATVAPGINGLPQEKSLADLVQKFSKAITDRMPPGLLKRWPGYALDRFLRAPANVNELISGSEGTLAGIFSAKLKIVPLPRQKGLGIIFFASVTEAMQATVELLDLKPAAIEHVDRVLFDQTRWQIKFRAARDLLELDAKPCEAFLIVEFYDDVEDRLATLARKSLGLRTKLVTKPAEMELVWTLRKAGLSLLTGCKGPAKPVTGIEDTAVRPEDLPAYVAALQTTLKPLKIDACFYGHAAAGLLHIRPVLDLHSAEDIRKLRQIATEVASLVRIFKGSLAGEHGVGIARTEFLPEQLGPELMEAMRQIKFSFDPKNIFNPGKIIDDGRYKVDTNLRYGAGYELKLPFQPVVAFAAKDGSFVRNLEQCNGCGGCRKDLPTMCPTFIATGDEIMSTRGRANTIRAVLDSRLDPANLEIALSNCLGCKACTTECPSNVNLTLLKAELVHAAHKQAGLSLREKLLSSVDLLGRFGCAFPSIGNASLRSKSIRWLMEKTLGLHRTRPLPPYARETFNAWFARRQISTIKPTRGKVILWDDTFVRYHEPHIGKAAVAVLEAAGFQVVLLSNRCCCGRPAFSQGNLDKASTLGRHNLDLIAARGGDEPILFLEPSCYSMFAQDYRELKLRGAEDVAKRCYLFEDFLEQLLQRVPSALRFVQAAENVAIHAHCHAKSLLNPAFMLKLTSRAPGRNTTLLESGCCGMAGAFGAMASKYDLSLKVAEPLVKLIQAQPPGTKIIASGTSCRHQIEHLTKARPLHMAEWLADALGIRIN